MVSFQYVFPRLCCAAMIIWSNCGLQVFVDHSQHLSLAQWNEIQTVVEICWLYGEKISVAQWKNVFTAVKMFVL